MSDPDDGSDPLALAQEIVDQRIAEIRAGTRVADSSLLGEVRAAMNTDDVGLAYALATQPLSKVLAADVDIRQLDAFAWPGPSPRTLAKAVIAPLNERLGRPLIASSDPGISNPLRGGVLGDEYWRAKRKAHDLPKWTPTLHLLDAVEQADTPAEAASDLLDAVLAHLVEIALTPSTLVEKVLDTQARIAAGNPVYDERRDLLMARGTRMMDAAVTAAGVGLSVESSVGLGTPAEIPWLRLFHPEHSPTPTTGEYVVVLFSADGSTAFLCLIVGTEGTAIGDIDARVAQLRELLAADEAPAAPIDLRSSQSGGRPRAYEHGTLTSVAYSRGSVPTDVQIIEDIRAMAALLDRLEAQATPDPGGLLHRLTLEAVREAIGQLVIPDSVLRDAIAALRSGKHLLLTGPPGTGKTTLGQALALAAQRVGVCDGYTTVTATATWTSYDTIGGYQQQLDGTLRFQPGAALRSIDERRWLVVDELNRADVDKALGPLFTVLSGQAVELTMEEAGQDGQPLPVSIVPEGEEAPANTSVHTVAPGWRLIATMNTRDQDLLFNLSFALLRRFAVITVDPPPADEVASLLGEVAPLESDLASSVAALAMIPGAQLGPAVLLAAARFLHERAQIAGPEEQPGDWMASAIASEVVPQLAHLSSAQLSQAASYLAQRVMTDRSPQEVAAFLEEQVGLPVEVVEDESEGDSTEFLGDAD